MKRITQILASILFVITVLTVYFAFDFAINSAITHKTAARKRLSHVHSTEHGHAHTDLKTTKKRSLDSHVFKRTNSTSKRHNNDEHYLHSQTKAKLPIRAKPGSFHKGRTGVKVNKPPNLLKTHRKNSSSTTTTMIKSFRKDKLARV